MAHRQALRTYIRRRGFSHDDAEDLAQEVIVRAWRYQGSVREACLTSWLYQIAANLTVDQVRRRRLPIVPLDLAENAALPERDTFAGSEAYDLILESLAELAPGQREILRLRFEEQLSIAEIAGRLQCSDGAAKLRVFRAIEALRHRCGVRR